MSRVCAKLLKQLKVDPPPELILHLEGHPRQSPGRGQQTQPNFEERLKFVRDNWAILKIISKTLDDVRNKISGHVEIKLNPVELTVESTDWKSPEFFLRKKTEIFEFAHRP